MSQRNPKPIVIIRPDPPPPPEPRRNQTVYLDRAIRHLERLGEHRCAVAVHQLVGAIVGELTDAGCPLSETDPAAPDEVRRAIRRLAQRAAKAESELADVRAQVASKAFDAAAAKAAKRAAKP